MGDCRFENERNRRKNETDLEDIEDLLKKIICLLKRILEELEEDCCDED